MGGSIASFDSIALRMRIASALGIPSSRVRIEAEAASVRVRVLIDSTSGAEAQEVAGTLATFSSNTTALTAALDVNVLSIVQMPIAEAAVVASSTMGGAASTPASLLFAPALPPMPSQAIRVGGGLPSGALLIIVASLGGLAALISLLAFVFSPCCRSWFRPLAKRSSPWRRLQGSARSASHASPVTADETLQNRPSSSSSSFFLSLLFIYLFILLFILHLVRSELHAGAPADLDVALSTSCRRQSSITWTKTMLCTAARRGLRRDSNLAVAIPVRRRTCSSERSLRNQVGQHECLSWVTYTPEYAHMLLAGREAQK